MATETIDETRDETTDDTTDETTPETEGEETDKAKGSEGGTPRVGLHGLLTRDSDMAARPGFRNPANARSKAQKPGKKGKKKR